MITGVIFPALRGLVDDRCHLGGFPQPPDIPVWPAIGYYIISEAPVATICGTNGGATDETLVQIEYVARTDGAAIALQALGRAALMLVYPPCVRDGGFQRKDVVTNTYRCVDEYKFNPSSPASS